MIDTTTLLEVTTLGRFEVRRNHVPLSGGYWSRRKVNDLFKLLLSAEQHRLHREQIQDILWPDSTSEQAANSFGKTLYLLRRALEPDLVAGKGGASIYVLLERDTLMLIPESMSIDADFFESSVQPLQAKMRSRSPREREVESDQLLLNEFDLILSLYKGDYLPDDLYEDWAQRRRDRLRRLYSWLLENAARLALENTQRQKGQRGQRAVEYLQALIERNSADEQTHRQLMLVYARMGRRSDALNQFQLLCVALRNELDAEPLPETVELHRRIQAGQITVDLWESQQLDDVSLTAGRETEENVSSQDSATGKADRADGVPTREREGGSHTIASYMAVANGSDVDALQGAINQAPTVIDQVEAEAEDAVGEQDQVNPSVF